jgi:thiol-disulfide isomerase/thioredoxin
MHRILTGSLACALLLLLACAACSDDAGPAPQTGKAEEARAVAGADYPSLSLDQYKALVAESAGKTLLVCIWSVNCPACQQELPVLEQLADSHDPDKLRVVYASLDPASQTISDFFGDYLPLAEIVRVGNDVAAYTGSEYIPRLIVYSTAGEVSFIDSGFYPAAMLEALLKRAGLE